MSDPAERPYLSFSRLGTFGKCPKQYQLSYIEQVPQVPQGALAGGSAIHDAIELAEAEEWWDTDAGVAKAGEYFRDRFRQLVDEAGGPATHRWGGRKTREWPDGENHHWWLQNGALLMIPTYAKVRRNDAEQGVLKVEQAELQVLTELPGAVAADGGSVMLKGYIDLQVVIDSDGVRRVRDWKSGSSNAEPIQLAGYCWQLQQTGARVTEGEFVYLRRPNLEKAVAVHDVAELIPLVPELYRDLAVMLLAAQAGNAYAMQPNSFCVACKVRMSCGYGRTLGPAPEGWTSHPEEELASAS